MEYHIDATDKILGRLAAEIAIRLRGKNTPAFSPTQCPSLTVIVTHTDRLRFTGKKIDQKLYRRHSGYPGGLKTEILKDRMKNDSRKVLSDAVSGMLPKNRLRARLMRNLILKQDE